MAREKNFSQGLNNVGKQIAIAALVALGVIALVNKVPMLKNLVG